MALPCPFFDLLSAMRTATQMDAVENGGAVMAARMTAERVDSREVVLAWPHLTDTELADLEAVWNGGAALFEPFTFTVPGEGVGKSFVFKDGRLNVRRLSATVSSAEITLLEVF